MLHEVDLQRTNIPGEIALTLKIDAVDAKAWREAAIRNGLDLAEWVTLSLTLADRLSLADGYEKTPSIGRRLDPVLAEAIIESAKGKPWEHRAMLLIGMANPIKDREITRLPRGRARIPPQLIEVFDEFGIPFSDTAPANQFAVIGRWVVTWQELALILLIWKDSQFDWCYISMRGLQERTGMTLRDARKAVERTTTQGIVKRSAIRGGGIKGRGTSRSQISQELGEALLRGEIRPAVEDDAYSESYLIVQSRVSASTASGSKVDPLMIEASRDAAKIGRTSASDVIKMYLEKTGQSTT